MFIGSILLTIVVPIAIHQEIVMESIVKPYIAQAVIDSALIIGLPPSRAARDYAKKIQSPDPILREIMYTSQPMTPRKLFFIRYFNQAI